MESDGEQSINGENLLLKPSLNETARPHVTDALLADITQRIVQAFAPHAVILFGSYAYGKPHKDSDVDLLIIMDSDETPHQRIMRVTQVAKVPYLPMDILARTPQEVASRLALGDYFIKEIMEKGKALYHHATA